MFQNRQNYVFVFFYVFFWTKINGERESFLDFTPNKTLFKKGTFSNIQSMKKYVGE